MKSENRIFRIEIYNIMIQKNILYHTVNLSFLTSCRDRYQTLVSFF
jgi:hypothetical protein